MLCGQLLGNTITLTYFSNSWCKHFQQDATNLSLEHFKEQHTGIWCLLVKYLLWQCAMWTTFGKHNYFDLFFEQLVQALSTGRYESFFGTFQRTTYWNLVPTGEVFALVVVCGQLLGNVSTLADFRTVGASTLNRTLRNFLWNISKNNILEFGIYWRSICVGSAIWTKFRNHNFSGRFLNSSCKPFAQSAMDLSLEHPKE